MVPEKVRAGVEDALRHYSDGGGGGRTFVVSTPDVRAIRHSLQLSQNEFAAGFGIPIRTLQNWEQGERIPEGPARAYLAVIEHDPSAVMRALEKSRAQTITESR